MKKIEAVKKGLSRFFALDNNGGYASIERDDLDIDSEGNVFGGKVVIRYGREGMPPHGQDVVKEEEIEEVMRNHQRDLRKWV